MSKINDIIFGGKKCSLKLNYTVCEKKKIIPYLHTHTLILKIFKKKSWKIYFMSIMLSQIRFVL